MAAAATAAADGRSPPADPVGDLAQSAVAGPVADVRLLPDHDGRPAALPPAAGLAAGGPPGRDVQSWGWMSTERDLLHIFGS